MVLAKGQCYSVAAYHQVKVTYTLAALKLASAPILYETTFIF